MRHILNIFPATLLISILMTCCQHHDNIKNLGWTRVSPLVDSLTAEIEKQTVDFESADSAEILIDSLAVAAKDFPKELHLEERVMYLRTGVSTIRMQKDSASRMLHILESRVDSASDPYLFNRIRSRQWALKNSSDYKIHNSLLRQIEIYESFGDSVGIACNMVHLCVRYLAVNEDSAALNCTERAERIFNNIGYRQAAFKNVINKAIVFDRLGDTISRNNMVRELLQSNSLRDNAYFNTALMVDAYVYLHEPRYLHAAYGLAKSKPGLEGVTALVEAIMAREYYSREMADSADWFALRAWNNLDSANQFQHKAEICESMITYHTRHNEYRQLADMLRIKQSFLDSARIEAGPLETAKIKYQYELEKDRMLSERKKSETRLIFTIILLAVALVSGAVILFLILRNAKTRTRMLCAELESQQHLQSAAASAISAAEKENRLREMAKLINESKKEGDIDEAKADNLLSTLKINIIEAGDWNKFTEIFSRLHPDFDHQLLSRYPSLSLKQVRLCQYIKIGLDTSQIAHLLSVKPESVWQSRWRLKQKMGLDSDESLMQVIGSIE